MTINWRQIETALQDYFGGVNIGDVFADVESDTHGLFDPDICDSCPLPAVKLNLTELAKHIADSLAPAR